MSYSDANDHEDDQQPRSKRSWTDDAEELQLRDMLWSGAVHVRSVREERAWFSPAPSPLVALVRTREFVMSCLSVVEQASWLAHLAEHQRKSRGTGRRAIKLRLPARRFAKLAITNPNLHTLLTIALRSPSALVGGDAGSADRLPAIASSALKIVHAVKAGRGHVALERHLSMQIMLARKSL